MNTVPQTENKHRNLQMAQNGAPERCEASASREAGMLMMKNGEFIYSMKIVG